MSCKDIKLSQILLILGFVLILVILTKSTSGDPINECIEVLNLPCQNCITINVSISSGIDDSEYVIEDYQTYNVSIRNIGNNTINTTFTVKVYDPTPNQIGVTRTFAIMLIPNETKSFIPNQTGKDGIIDIYPFDMVGSYKIVVDSEESNILFYRFFPQKVQIDSTRYIPICKYTFQPSFTYHYDVISKADKQWRDTLRNWQTEAQNWQIEARELNKNMLDINQIVYFLTIVNLILVCFTVFKEEIIESIRTKAFLKFLIPIFVVGGISWYTTTYILVYVYEIDGFHYSVDPSDIVYGINGFTIPPLIVRVMYFIAPIVNLLLLLPDYLLSHLNTGQKFILVILWQSIIAIALTLIMKKKEKKDYCYNYSNID